MPYKSSLFLFIKKRSPTLEFISSTSIVELKGKQYLQHQKESKARICGNITPPTFAQRVQNPPATLARLPVPRARGPGSELSHLPVWASCVRPRLLADTRTPYLVMSRNWITDTREQKKKEARLQLHGTERRSRYRAPAPRPTAGRCAVGPVILPPPRAPPRARDRSGAFRPRAGPPSAHRR